MEFFFPSVRDATRFLVLSRHHLFLVTITSKSIISSWYCHKDYDDDEDEDDDNDDDNADAQVKECSNGEDEFDCDWHKRSTVDTVSTRDQFER